MNPDDFEKRLQRQPLRELPPEWRSQILKSAVPSRHSPPVACNSFLSTINHQLSTLLWPHPKAWATLAALWVGIAVAQFAASDHAVHVTKRPQLPSREEIVLLQQQTRLMTELVGRTATGDLDRPKSSAPQPRSERRTETSFA
jgi:hypothetical protein